MVFDTKHGLDMKRLRESRLYGHIIDFANVSYPNRMLRKLSEHCSFPLRAEEKKEGGKVFA